MAHEITASLIEARRGDPAALSDLFERLYPELRRLAHGHLRGQETTGTLGTTALIHEAYLKLCDHDQLEVRDRAHFFALSAKVMRQIMVDYFRSRATLKRGAAARALPLDEVQIPVADRGDTLLALDEALDRLETLDARLARVVECRFFGGMTQEEIAEALGLTPRTIRSDWRKAKAWLGHELGRVA